MQHDQFAGLASEFAGASSSSSQGGKLQTSRWGALRLQTARRPRRRLPRGERLVDEFGFHDSYLCIVRVYSLVSTAAIEARPRLGVHLAFALALALVVQLLAFSHRQLHLDQAVLQIQLGGDHGQAAFPGGVLQLSDFRAMQQQLAPAHRLVIHDVAVRVLADVGVHQPGLVCRDFAEGVLELDLAVAGRLDLGSGEDQTGLNAV